MPKISVVVPVYNTEKYVKKCLESIINQTMQDFEIIVVDDGSTDNSAEVINEVIRRNKNSIIKYYKKENGGLSDARNFGVKYAQGKYISFIDSDDYIDKTLFENLEKYIDEDIDLIKFKMKTVDENGNLIKNISGPIFENYSGERAFEILSQKEKFLEVACIYLYNREFWNRNNFKYSIGLYHEDFGLTPLILVLAKSVVSTDIYGYNYVQTENSITRTEKYEKTLKKAYDNLVHYDNMIKRLKDIKITDKSAKKIKSYYSNAIILKTATLNKKDMDKYIIEIKKRNLTNDIEAKTIKQKIKKLILKLSIKSYLKIKI